MSRWIFLLALGCAGPSRDRRAHDARPAHDAGAPPPIATDAASPTPVAEPLPPRLRTVARFAGQGECPSPIGQTGEWLVTRRLVRGTVVSRIGSDGSVLGDLPGLDGVDVICPAPSPDGARIAYTVRSRDRREHVEVRPIQGGRRISCGEGYAPGWTPDGKRVVFTTTGREGASFVSCDRATGRRVGGIPQPPGLAIGSRPMLSPDGSTLAFSAGPEGVGGGGSNIWVVPMVVQPDALFGGARTLTPQGTRNSWPIWSPDGTFLVYTSSETNRDSDLWTVPREGGAPRRLFSTPEMETYPVVSGSGLRWIADAEWTNALYRYELGDDASRPEVMVESGPEQEVYGVGRDHEAIVVRQTDDDSDIWVIPIGGGPARPLVVGSTYDASPQVSADGTRVAFLRRTEAGTDVWLTPIDRPAPRALTTSGAASDNAPPLPSPDGTRVAYFAAPPGRTIELVVQRVSGGAPVRIAGYQAGWYAWDPSGTSLYVAMNDSLQRFPADGSGPSSVVHRGESIASYVALLPGGREILNFDFDTFRLERIDLASGRASPVATLAQNVSDSSVRIAMDPDGRHVVVSQSLVWSELREAPDLAALVAGAR